MSIDWIAILRATNMAAWSSVLVMLVKPVWRVLTGKPEYYDVLWALIAGFALMVLGFNLRWFIASESMTAYVGLYVYSILLAFLTVRAVRSYQGAHDG